MILPATILTALLFFVLVVTGTTKKIAQWWQRVWSRHNSLLTQNKLSKQSLILTLVKLDSCPACQRWIAHFRRWTQQFAGRVQLIDAADPWCKQQKITRFPTICLVDASQNDAIVQRLTKTLSPKKILEWAGL